MQREIKFRAKRKDNNKWAFGDLVKDNAGGAWIETNLQTWRENCDDVDAFGSRLYVDIDSVGQFTGLTDKNGREIYEGDIIKFHFMTSSPSTSELFPTKKFFGEITTNKYNQWTILSDGLEIHIENAIKYGEIIGNIYDNKELLEE